MTGQLVPRIETSTVARPTLRSRANPRSYILTRRVNARGPKGDPGTGGGGGGGGAPSGPAGGDLTGTYPNPAIGAGKVTSSHIADGTIIDADINAAAGIAQSKIANLTTDLAAKVSKSTVTQAGQLLIGTGSGTVGTTPAPPAPGLFPLSDWVDGKPTVTWPGWNPGSFAPREWERIAFYETVTPNVWPTFTSASMAARYRLRVFSSYGSASSNGGLIRNLLLVFDNNTTPGSYYNAGSSASAISVAMLPQGGAGTGVIEFTRSVVTLIAGAGTRYGVTARSDATTVLPSGSTSRVASSHSYLYAGSGQPNLSTWAISASNNDVWAPGIQFILEGSTYPS